MEFFSNPQVWTIVTVLVTGLGVHFMAKADRRRQLDTRISGLKGEFDARIGGLKSELDARFNELDARISSLKSELDARFNELDARISSLKSELGSRIDGLGSRIDGLEQRIDGLERRIGGLEQRIDGLKDELDARFSGLRSEFVHRIDRLEDRVDGHHREISAALSETRAEVSALSARLDERSSPRRLVARPSGVLGGVVPEVSVREGPEGYSGDEPRDEAPQGSQRAPAKEPSGQA